MNWSQMTVLDSGGTGSFGWQFARVSIRYSIGDIRNADRLRRATQGKDVVVHAAALKQVPACEYNPREAVKTNIDGTKNIIDAALDTRVKKVLALSTDKAVSPVNLYFATKLAEKLVVQANVYSGSGPTRFSCVRYGNVVGRRGSVIPLFLGQRKMGTLTDRRLTRFWLTVERGVRFVISAIERMKDDEVFLPKIASMRMMDLAQAIAPGCALREVLISEDESRNALEKTCT